MKVEFELDGQQVKKIEEILNIDVKVLLREFISEFVDGLFEVVTATMAGVPITQDMVEQFKTDIASKAMKKAERKRDET